MLTTTDRRSFAWILWRFSMFSVAIWIPGACFSKFAKAVRAQKLRPAYSVKLVFSYVVKAIQIKITAKFRASRRLRFEDYKENCVTRNAPENFRDLRETGPWIWLRWHMLSLFSYFRILFWGSVEFDIFK